MQRTRGMALSLAVPGILLAAIAAQAQNSDSPQLIPRTPEQREQMYRAEHRIRLNVTVTDAAGKALSNLTAANFTLIDNGKPRPIAALSGGDGGAGGAAEHATIVIDAVSSHDALGRERKELEKFLSSSRGPLPFPVNLAVVTENGVNESAFSMERSALAADLNRMTEHVKGPECDEQQPDSDLTGRMSGSFGGSAPNESAAMVRERCNNDKFVDSINFLQKLLEDSHAEKGRGILIWLGQGWPIPSAPDTGQILPGVSGRDFAEPIAMLVTELREADVTLDAVTWSDFRRAKGPRDADANAARGPASIADLTLPTLASDSGGQATEKSKSLGDAVAACLAEAQNYYTVSFDATPSAAPDEFHRIEVKVDKPGAVVRTATAYYAQP